MLLRNVLPALMLAAICGGVQAETLLIESVEQAGATRLDRPERGQSMTAVRERYGEPSVVAAAVGEPPITRWEYPGFVVYFEGDRVIHAVARR